MKTFILVLITTAVVLFLVCLFCVWDAGKATQPRVTESPSYWQYQDSIDPREDTLHIVPYNEIHNGS